MATLITYGPGGFDPSKPDKNIIRTDTVPDDPERVAEDAIHDGVDKALDGLRQIANSTGTLTGAQLSNGMRLLARVVIRLSRLQLHKLDGTD